MIDVQSGIWYFYHYDALGSVVALSNTSGTIVEQYRYDAFGNTKVYDGSGTEKTDISTFLGNPYMFTGRRLDTETRDSTRTGLYYYRARTYYPELGRFMQTDPIGYYDSMNLYQYCGNNPVNWIDPWGLKEEKRGWWRRFCDWFWGNAPQEIAEEAVEHAVDKLYVNDGDASMAGEGLQAAAKMGLIEPDDVAKVARKGAKECQEKAAKETAQKGIKETFPDAKELAKKLGVSKKGIHGVKKDIVKQTRDYGRKIGSTNPDIGVDGLGNIVLKNPKTGKTINTGIPLESFKD